MGVKHISNQKPALIVAMMNPALYDHPVDRLELIETHISWVILTGPYAYKIKKPVNLGFLDFSTLEKRRFYCDEEVRLNRRLAEHIYLGVVSIIGPATQPELGSHGQDGVIEYAVKMVQFPQQAQLDRLLAAGKLRRLQLDSIAAMVADFHHHIEVADQTVVYGLPGQVYQPMAENFVQIREQYPAQHGEQVCLSLLDKLEQWSRIHFITLRPLLEERKEDGYIRECHGDLHLRNLAWVDAAPLAFDCIEFNPDLRWIDVISEVAFMVMDLQAREQPGFSQRFLNSYLEYTGDYAGCRVLAFYMVYRAMVRAKVNAIRSCQAGIEAAAKEHAEQALLQYLQLAQSCTETVEPQLIITYGMSATGKTTVTQGLLEMLAAIRIRSDVERKRLFGLAAEQPAHAAAGEGIYTTAASQRTYRKLVELAGYVLDAGYTVIIDATCQKYEQRELFRQLASMKRVPYIILEFSASAETLRERIVSREKGASDADLAVLEGQIAHWQPLRDEERDHALTIDTEALPSLQSLAGKIRDQQQ